MTRINPFRTIAETRSSVACGNHRNRRLLQRQAEARKHEPTNSCHADPKPVFAGACTRRAGRE